MTRLDQPGTAVKLTASDSTDEGFTAAAASRDGTIVAAVCGSFLHIWRQPKVKQTMDTST